MRWSGATGAIARGKRVSTGCGRKRRSVPAWPWICSVKPKPKAVNKPSPHSIVHGLDKPGAFTTVSVLLGFSQSIFKFLLVTHLVEMRHRVVFGTPAAVAQVLAACGWQINTAFVERLNLSLRQHVAAIGRRATPLCKGEDGLRQQLALYQVYHNFVLPHASLHQPLPQPLPTHGHGSAKTWQ